MSIFLRKIQALVAAGEVRISEHGYDELAKDDLLVSEVVNGLSGGVLVEEYADYPKGPCVLVRQHDTSNRYIHVVWGVPRGYDKPVVLVTAYRPDPLKWSVNGMRRIT